MLGPRRLGTPGIIGALVPTRTSRPGRCGSTPACCPHPGWARSALWRGPTGDTMPLMRAASASMALSMANGPVELRAGNLPAVASHLLAGSIRRRNQQDASGILENKLTQLRSLLSCCYGDGGVWFDAIGARPGQHHVDCAGSGLRCRAVV